ncbi:MAG: ATP-binding protein, partial [Hydrogenovibrio sp.]|nr:ATP-binding protein [Hydrogenovibrio sp.]
SENRDWIMERVGRCIEEGEGWTGLLPIVQKNGKPVVTSANVNVIMDGQGRIENIFNLMSDYTPELERQNQLKQAKEAAEEASQAKSEFLSSMSHELRTPLNAVLGFTQILEFDDNLTQTQKDNLQEIIRAGNHLLALINDVLDLAKIESGNLEVSVEVVRLNELVEECLQLVNPMAEKKSIEVVYIEDTDLELKIDRVKLKQVFLNLLSNAVKYNHEGGRVRIEVELFDENAFRIVVSDTGVGVPEKDRSNLFQPFNRLGQERGPIEGTGVGLSITKTLVELMDGDIYYRPNKPNGSRFYIEFSQNKFYRGEALEDLQETVSSQQAKSSQFEELTDFISTLHPPKVAPPEAIEEHNPRKRSRTILYIEDNEANIELVSKILSKRKSVKLLTASEALEGLDLMKQCVPQLILLDIGLPDLDGFELLKTIKADLELKSIPVIATTAYASPSDIEKIYQAGFDGYIEKPHDIERFLMVIDQFLMIIDQFIEDE